MYVRNSKSPEKQRQNPVNGYGIGSTKDAALIVERLSDSDKSIVYAASKTLAIIGGPREVVAMEAWLSGPVYAEDKQMRAQVKKSRDELSERLAKIPKPH